MNDLVDGQRQEDYGDPVENMTLVAVIWSGYLSVVLGYPIVISGESVADMMAQFKLARLMNSPNHQDSLDDFNGYIEIARRCDGGTNSDQKTSSN